MPVVDIEENWFQNSINDPESCKNDPKTCKIEGGQSPQGKQPLEDWQLDVHLILRQ